MVLVRLTGKGAIRGALQKLVDDFGDDNIVEASVHIGRDEARFSVIYLRAPAPTWDEEETDPG